MKDKNENWPAAFETAVEFEATMVADRLKDTGIPAVVMKRQEKYISTAFSEQKLIQVLVQPDRLEEAREVLSQQPLTDEELEQAALNASMSDDEEGE